MLTALKHLRVPPASRTPGAPRDRPSASQVPLLQQDHRPDPDRDRPAHGAHVPASSPRVPDARRGARPLLGVAGPSTPTRSPARSRARSASSRRWSTCEFPPRPRRPARRATAPRRRRYLNDNKLQGTFPIALCGIETCSEARGMGTQCDEARGMMGTCYADTGNPVLVAPCGVSGCCDLEEGKCEIKDRGSIAPAATTSLRVPPRPRRPMRHATPPPRSDLLHLQPGPIPTEVFQLTELQHLRVPPASPTPGAARDRPSASQALSYQRHHRPDPARDRPAHDADEPASPPRVPDAWRGARQPLDVVGGSSTTSR